MPTRRKSAKTKPPRQGLSGENGTWQVQTAKARFSEVLRLVRSEGPQIVTRQGKEDVVILPVEQYRKLTRRARQSTSLVQFFAQSPLAGIGLNLERERDYGREIEL